MDRWTSFLTVLMRVFLGAVFAYSGFIKLVEPIENFIANVEQYRIIPAFLVPTVARIVPWIEYLLGSYLIAGYAPRATALMLGGMSLALIGVILASGRLWGAGDASCGCFGQSGLQLTTKQIFLVDIANVFIGIQLFRLKNHPVSMDRLLRK